jgi:hypothetical protein
MNGQTVIPMGINGLKLTYGKHALGDMGIFAAFTDAIFPIVTIFAGRHPAATAFVSEQSHRGKGHPAACVSHHC